MESQKAQELIDSIDISFRYSTLPKADKRMIEKIAWGEGVENVQGISD